MLQVSPATGPVRRGECYVRVTLLMAGFAVGRLIAGYVTDGATLAWPGGNFENFTDGQGLLRSITGTDPAPGVEISETVPTNTRWRIKLIRLVLATDATVTERRTLILFNDGATTLQYISSQSGQTASLIYQYEIASHGYQPTLVIDRIFLPLPTEPMILMQAYQFKTVTLGMVAGDNYAAPQLYVEEWIEE